MTISKWKLLLVHVKLLMLFAASTTDAQQMPPPALPNYLTPITVGYLDFIINASAFPEWMQEVVQSQGACASRYFLRDHPLFLCFSSNGVHLFYLLDA